MDDSATFCPLFRLGTGIPWQREKVAAGHDKVAVVDDFLPVLLIKENAPLSVFSLPTSFLPSLLTGFEDITFHLTNQTIGRCHMLSILRWRLINGKRREAQCVELSKSI